MRTITLAVVAFAAPLLADSFGSGFTGYSFTPVFQNKTDSPGTPLIPVSYGGISARPGEPNQLLIGGGAEGAGAAFYSVGVARDSGGHIYGLTGTKTVYASAPKLASGAAFGPSLNAGEVFFYSIASGSGGVDVGMVRWGSAATAKTVGVVPDSPGGLGFVPAGFGGFQQMKLLTTSGRFYTVAYRADADGTYDLVRADLAATLPVANVQSFVYVKAGSPGFAVDSMLVAEFATGSIAAYEVDGSGNPRPGTRRTFFSGPPFARAEGMMVDPVSGDVLVTTFSSSTSGIYRISGFLPVAGIPVSGCQSIVAPGNYYLATDIGPAVGIPCIRIRDTSNVHLSCKGHSITGYVTVDNTRDFSMQDCVLPSTWVAGVPDEQRPAHLTISNSQNGLVSRNLIGTHRSQWFFVKVRDSAKLNFVDNQIYAFLNMTATMDTTQRFNRVATPSTYIGGDLISSENGARNVVASNTMDGVNIEAEGWVTAIWLTHESNAVVFGNDIVCGAFCIYLYSVTGGSVNANMTRGGMSALEGHRVTDVVWSNHKSQYVYNAGIYLTEALRNTLYRNHIPSDGSVIEPVAFPSGQNLIRENVFGHTVWYPARGNPSFGNLPVPAGSIIDGGGNVCVPAPGPYPLVCK